MCDYQFKLVAWLDEELPPQEAESVSRHVEGCAECRRLAARIRNVSEALDAYCDAVIDRNESRRSARWAPVLVAGVLAAAAGVVFLAMPRAGVTPKLPEPTAAMAVHAPAIERTVAKPAQAKIATHRHPAAPRASQYITPTPPMDTAVQIAIPADAMFPPGTLPDGVNFIADLRIAPDGTVKQVRLRQ